MRHGYANRVWCDTATLGTGAVTIGAARGSHCTPAQAGTPNLADRTWLLEEGNDFELFRGVYTASGTTVSRGTVLLSQIAGVTGTTRMTLAGAATIREVVAAEDLAIPKKNHIIDGAMMVSQENGSTVGTATGYYAVDTFRHFNDSAATVQFSQQNVVTPGGSPYRIRSVVTVADTSIGATDIYVIAHSIEGYRVADLQFGTANAKSFTLIFGVKAPAGTYAVCVRNASNNRSYLAEFTIAPGEANTDVRKAVVILGDTSGTWDKTNGVGFGILWTAACGSTYQTAAGAWTAGNYISTPNVGNFLGAVSNTFELFDVAMYEGVWSVDLAPEFVVPDFDETLRKCLRYWAKSYDYPTAIGTVTSLGMAAYLTGNGVATSIGGNVVFQTQMRIIPAVTVYSQASGFAGFVYNAGGGFDTAGVIDSISRDRFRVYGNASYGMYCHWKADARL